MRAMHLPHRHISNEYQQIRSLECRIVPCNDISRYYPVRGTGPIGDTAMTDEKS